MYQIYNKYSGLQKTEILQSMFYDHMEFNKKIIKIRYLEISQIFGNKATHL